MMAGKGNAFLGWVIGSGGIVLAYSAYKNKGPLSVIQTALGSPGATVKPIQTSFGTGTASGVNPALPNTGGGTAVGAANVVQTSQSAIARAQALRGHSVSPTLVKISGTNFLLDQMAAQSLEQVQSILGFRIPLTGTFRTSAQQAAGYASSPNRFAPPGSSLHEVGLAIDISSAVPGGWDNPTLVAALQNAGWYRRGKVINGRPEPWHWSFGVPG